MDEASKNQVEPATEPSSAGATLAARPDTPHSAEEVFHLYAPRVYNLARRMLGGDADAEDVTQDVLLQVVRKLPSFRGESAFPTWLHRVTVNAALAHRRRRATQSQHRDTSRPLEQVLEEDPPLRPARPWSVGPEEAALDHETQQLIERAIALLPDDYRDVIVLSDVEGLSNAAIGEMLGLSVPAVKSRLHRARLKLRDALAPYFEEVSA